MPTSAELRDLAIRHGETKKRHNAVAALLSGFVPALLLTRYMPASGQRWLIGFVLGLIWANAVEYSYHRWLLHRPHSILARGHREHHSQVGTPVEAEHVTLGSSPINVVLLFVINGLIAVPIDLLLGLHLLPGIFAGWTLYILAAEEIHWRIHMQGWLPPGLRFARAYHMNHHDIPNTRYNVFLPLFDFLFDNAK